MSDVVTAADSHNVTLLSLLDLIKLSLWLCRSRHTAVSAAVYLWIGRFCAGVDQTGPSKCWVVVCLRWCSSCLASHRSQFLVFSFCAVHGRGAPYHCLVWAYRSLLCWRHSVMH